MSGSSLSAASAGCNTADCRGPPLDEVVAAADVSLFVVTPTEAVEATLTLPLPGMIFIRCPRDVVFMTRPLPPGTDASTGTATHRALHGVKRSLERSTFRRRQAR